MRCSCSISWNPSSLPFNLVNEKFANSTPRYVALKIMTAKASTASSTELSILDHLSKQADSDSRSQHLTILFDSFEHQGINGTHQCLVFEPMGSTAASFVEQLPENQPHMRFKAERYPPWMAKKILLHALRGLAFLHDNGVVHGDFQPGNMLFAIDMIAHLEEDDLKQDEDTKDTIPVNSVDGKEDKWAPKNLYLKQPLYDHVEVGPELCVKLSDLGAGESSSHMNICNCSENRCSNNPFTAFWSDKPPEDTVTPIALRSPELILHHAPISSAIDIWSFGCLVFEFLTGRTLFAVGIWGRCEEAENDADDDHLTQMHNIIEHLPDSIMDAWPRKDKWFAEGMVPKPPEGMEEPVIEDPLEKMFAEEKHPDINDEEAEVVCGLIRSILVYDPAKRPSAEEILEHPWFKE